MFCKCEDYKENIDKINNYIILQAIRTRSKGYDGKPFVYCPWCSQKLEKEKEYDT